MTDEQLRRDIIAQATSISNIVLEMRKSSDEFRDFKAGVESDRKVRAVEDEHLKDRLDRIEVSIKNLNTLGKWIVGSFAAAFVTAAASFVINGGLVLVPH